MKHKKQFITIIILMVMLLSITNSIFAKETNEDKIKLDKSNITLRGYGDLTEIKVTVDQNYSLEDVSFKSSDENVVKVQEASGKHLIEAQGPGSGTITASIKDSSSGEEYTASCNVTVQKNILVTSSVTTWTNKKVELNIDMYDPTVWSRETIQVAQIKIESPNNEGTSEWIELGRGVYGEALNKVYKYEIEDNSKVTIRGISFWNNREDEYNERYKETIKISNIDKVVPTIKDISIDTLEDSATILVNAIDSQSGISKYTYICDELKINESISEPSYKLTGLEKDKTYNVQIIIEDNATNKVSENKTLLLKNDGTIPKEETPKEEENGKKDNTVSPGILPKTGPSSLIGIMLIIIGSIGVFSYSRMQKYKNM